MTNSRYRAGYLFERRISAHLRSEGYFVLESRGSHGAADIVAVKRGEILAIQAKSDGAISPAEWNELYEACQQYGMVPLLACREKRKLVFYRLVGRKVPRSRVLPREIWSADRIEGAA